MRMLCYDPNEIFEKPKQGYINSASQYVITLARFECYLYYFVCAGRTTQVARQAVV